MIILLLLFAAVVWAWLRGGKITNLGYVSIKWSGLVLIGFMIQVVIFTPIWQDHPGLVPHTATFYVISLELILVALVANLQHPGIWLILIGFGLNFAAIAANGGYMPASQDSLAAAGLTVLLPGEVSHNSVGAGPGTPLAFLGDIFAIPQSWILPNVFSIGDLVIAVGAARLTYGLTIRRPKSQKRAPRQPQARGRGIPPQPNEPQLTAADKAQE